MHAQFCTCASSGTAGYTVPEYDGTDASGGGSDAAYEQDFFEFFMPVKKSRSLVGVLCCGRRRAPAGEKRRAANKNEKLAQHSGFLSNPRSGYGVGPANCIKVPEFIGSSLARPRILELQSLLSQGIR